MYDLGEVSTQVLARRWAALESEYQELIEKKIEIEERMGRINDGQSEIASELKSRPGDMPITVSWLNGTAVIITKQGVQMAEMVGDE